MGSIGKDQGFWKPNKLSTINPDGLFTKSSTFQGKKEVKKMAKKVLIVDDEEDVRTYLNSLLSNNGYETEMAEDGEDAFRKVKEFGPNIVILDIIMPNQSGVGFYRNLKKSEIYSDIPVIILSGVTAYKDFFARERGGLPKPQEFVEKPFSTKELLSKIEVCVK
jgi:DNA-binding response OmpR family regulator